MKKKNDVLSFAIGAVIGTALAVYVANHQGIYAEAHKDALKPVAEVMVNELQEEVAENEPALVSLGEFKLTAYCSCEKCCGKWALNRPVDESGNQIVYGSSGEVLVEGTSIAVDKDVIPYGAEVLVNGCTYKAQDCGGAIEGNHIDVYFASHEEALKFGVQYAEVFMKKGDETNGT